MANSEKATLSKWGGLTTANTVVCPCLFTSESDSVNWYCWMGCGQQSSELLLCQQFWPQTGFITLKLATGQ